jgi:hypothetical protein
MQRGCIEPRTSWHKWGDFTTALGLSFTLEIERKKEN